MATKKESTMEIYTTTIRLTAAQARRVNVSAKAGDISMAQWLRRAVSDKLERDEHDRAALAAHAQMKDGAK